GGIAWAPEANQKSDRGYVGGNCDATGAVAIAAPPLPSVERLDARRPRRNVLSRQVRPTRTIRSMCELAENRQHLLGTEQHASSSPARSVTILELGGASRAQVEGLGRPRRALPPLAGEIEALASRD